MKLREPHWHKSDGASNRWEYLIWDPGLRQYYAHAWVEKRKGKQWWHWLRSSADSHEHARWELLVHAHTLEEAQAATLAMWRML